MAGSVNKVMLVGFLGRAPEIRSTQNGKRIATLSVATSESWRDKATGERKEHTEWSRVVIFNEKLVEVAEKYLRKGSRLYIEGALQTRKWVDKDGQERFSTEVVLQDFRGEITMLDERRGAGNGRQQPAAANYDEGDGFTEPRARAYTGKPGMRTPVDDLDDNIPF